MGFKYTVVCDTLGFIGYDFHENPEEILQTIKDAGYDGADLPGNPDKGDPGELRKLADVIGIAIPEVLGAWAYFHGGEDRDLASGNPEARERGVTYAKRVLDYASVLGATYLEICAPQPPVFQYGFPEKPIKELRQNFIEALKEIAAHAEGCGVNILLEPLNCYEAFPGVLTTLQHAVSIIEESGMDNIGIQPDVYHMNISEASMTDALRAAGKYIRHVHANETNHYTIGTGHADYPGIIRALKDIGFDGYLAIYLPFVSQEAFRMPGAGYGSSSSSDSSASRPDLKEHLERPLKYLKQIESIVDLERGIYRKD